MNSSPCCVGLCDRDLERPGCPAAPGPTDIYLSTKVSVVETDQRRPSGGRKTPGRRKRRRGGKEEGEGG